jgi:hypothetical protein
MLDVALRSEVVAVANEIAGIDAPAERRDLALRIAEAHVDLMRVRQTRNDLIARLQSDPDGGPLLVNILAAALQPKLAILNEYERRALSRRNRALREFDNLTL